MMKHFAALFLLGTFALADGYDDALARTRELAQTPLARDGVELNWLPGGTRAWYRVRTGAQSHQWVLVDAERGTRAAAFDHARLAAALKEKLGREVAAEALPMESVKFDLEQQRVVFRTGKDSLAWRLDTQALEPTAAVKPEAGAAGAPGDPGLRRSRNGGEGTTIVFINQAKTDVELFWVDTDGGQRSYGKIKVGESNPMGTYEGHVWAAKDAGGRELMRYRAGKPAEVAIPAEPVVWSKPEQPRVKDAAPRAFNAVTRDGNLFLRETATGTERQITCDGSAEDGYTGEVSWSPDGGHFVAMRRQKEEERLVTLVESSPGDQLQPKVKKINYLKPGDRIAVERPALFTASGAEVPVKRDLFSNPWDIFQLRWLPGGGEFVFLYNQRGHQVMRLLAVSASTGAVRTVIEETSQTFIDYSQKTYLHWLDQTNEALWASERDGWNHLYLVDVKSGAQRQITRGDWVVRGVDFVDEKARQIWFRACGIRAGQRQDHVHHARVNFDGSGLTILTEGDGTHRVTFSPDRRWLLDVWSRVDQPPVSELRRAADGALVAKLETADTAALERKGWRKPELFTAKGRDGKTDIWGAIVRPSRIEPGKKYPVIEHIYAGPHDRFAPLGFRATLGTMSELAEMGFIVVQCDGMGTNWRSRAFHDVAWKNLADAGFPDRIAWLRAAAAKYPELDLTRVGIFGGSAGGQNAMRALLDHGDFYTTAVADCGCHDNRMDKIWWNEAWLGWPVDESYARNSNVTDAHKLRGNLLLTWGELDSNVDPSSSMQVVNALIKANKPFEMLIIPGSNHGAGETPYAKRRRAEFFIRHLRP